MKAEQDMVQINRIALEKIQFGIRQYMSVALRDDMGLESEYDIYTDSIIKYLSFYLFANKVNQEECDDVVQVYPATMWEKLKQDFWPRWLKRKFPVRYSRDITHHTTKHYHICPHLNYKDDRKHLDFMMLSDNWGNEVER